MKKKSRTVSDGHALDMSQMQNLRDKPKVAMPLICDIPDHSMAELFIADRRFWQAVFGESPEAVDPRRATALGYQLSLPQP